MNISQSLPSAGRSIRFALLVPMLSVGLMLFPAGKTQAANGTWEFDANGNWNNLDTAPWVSDVVASGSGSTAFFDAVNITATRTVTLTAPNTIGSMVFGDTNTATAGVWILTNGGTASRTLTLAGTTPTITNNASGVNSRVAINLTIAGTDGLTKAGSGIVSLGNANTYTGGTSINAGGLRVRNSSSLGTGAATVASGAGLELDNGVNLANTINLNGAGGYTIDASTPSGALTHITGDNILSGAVNLQTASMIAMTGASGSVNISGSLNLGANQLDVTGGRTLTLSGAINGTGTLNLINNGGTTVITNDNSTTFAGQVNVVRSTVAIGHNGALGTGTVTLGVNDQPSGLRSTNTTARTISNALAIAGTTNSTYNFGSTTASANGDLTFSNTTTINLGGVRRFQVHNRTQFDAGFAGSGSGITMQTGTGTLVLNGASTYTGATTINAGTMLVNGSLSASSAVAVNAGGTLGGTNGTVGGVTVASGGSLAPGSSIGTFNTASVNLQSGGLLKLELNTGASTADQLNVTNAFNLALANDSVLELTLLGTDVALGGTTFTLVDYGTWNGGLFTYNSAVLADGAIFTLGLNQYQISYNGLDGSAVTLTVVPEPSASLLLIAGVGLYITARRKRRAR